MNDSLFEMHSTKFSKYFMFPENLKQSQHSPTLIDRTFHRKRVAAVPHSTPFQMNNDIFVQMQNMYFNMHVTETTFWRSNIHCFFLP